MGRLLGGMAACCKTLRGRISTISCILIPIGSISSVFVYEILSSSLGKTLKINLFSKGLNYFDQSPGIAVGIALKRIKGFKGLHN